MCSAWLSIHRLHRERGGVGGVLPAVHHAVGQRDHDGTLYRSSSRIRVACSRSTTTRMNRLVRSYPRIGSRSHSSRTPRASSATPNVVSTATPPKCQRNGGRHPY